MRVVMTAIQYSRGHMGQHIHEASEDDTAVSTSEGILRICTKVKSLRSENDVLRQQLKDFEEMRNCHDLSIPINSDDTWRQQVKTYVTTILFAQSSSSHLRRS
jgi:homospermidine synthase